MTAATLPDDHDNRHGGDTARPAPVRVMWGLLARARAAILGREAAWVGAVGLLAVVAVAVSPWGDYPLNDDWQYARAVYILHSTGRLVIDTPIAPALVGQVLLAWPFVALFGFSHVLLRILTLVVTGAILWALDALLRVAEVPRRFRLAGLALLAINPLLVNLGLSFMTECWGYAPAMVGAAIWFRSRQAADAKGRAAIVSVPAAVLAAALVGGTFWIRQYCVLVYPALVAAALVRLLAEREWGRLRASLFRLIASGATFLVIVWSYFAWTARHHQVRDQFSDPMKNMTKFSLADWQMSVGVQLIYMTWFLLPLLAMWRWRGRSWRPLAVAGGIALLFGLTGYSLVQVMAPDDAGSSYVHKIFPYSSSLIHAGGIGPITLSDDFFALARPDRYKTLSRMFWRWGGFVLVGLTAMWGFPLVTATRPATRSRARREVTLFAAVFGALSLAAVIQTYGRWAFDRYDLPILIALTIGVTALLATDEERAPRAASAWRPAVIRFAVTAIPLAYFTVGGMHDYLRWNDARWRLVDRARGLGVPSTSIDGGYEVNGWLSFDDAKSHPDESFCVGRCHCTIPRAAAYMWNCHDDSYRISMSVAPNYTEIAREKPRFWLGRGRSVILSRREQ